MYWNAKVGILVGIPSLMNDFSFIITNEIACIKCLGIVSGIHL